MGALRRDRGRAGARSRGPHTFETRAIDGIGRRETEPERWTWTITADAAARAASEPPVVTIISGPVGRVRTDTSTFTFASSVPGSTFWCEVDGGTYDCENGTLTHFTMFDGLERLRVFARGPDGTRGPDLHHDWDVNARPPNGRLDEEPGFPDPRTDRR